MYGKVLGNFLRGPIFGGWRVPLNFGSIQSRAIVALAFSVLVYMGVSYYLVSTSVYRVILTPQPVLSALEANSSSSLS